MTTSSHIDGRDPQISNSLPKESNHFKVQLEAIQSHEHSGNYSGALIIAQKCHTESLQVGLRQETQLFSETIERLQKEIFHLGSSRILFDENFKPRVKLLELLTLTGMQMPDPSELTITQINQWAQNNLLRRGERWEEQTIKFEELKPRIKPLLIDLGFVNATSAHIHHYQGAIVHGALLPRVRLRLSYLVEQWEQGVRFSHLYFFSGERRLEEQHENRQTLMHPEGSPLKIRKDWNEPSTLPATECEMAQLVWDQSELPEDMREQVTIHFINAPMKKDPKSERLIRPTTDDTVEEWVKSAPPEGCYLAVTNAPYINRQDLVVRTIAPDEYCFDTIGSGAGEQEKMAIFLDEVARLIFQTKQLADKQKS